MLIAGSLKNSIQMNQLEVLNTEYIVQSGNSEIKHLKLEYKVDTSRPLPSSFSARALQGENVKKLIQS